MGSKGAAKGAKPLERLGGKLRGRLACEESPDPNVCGRSGCHRPQTDIRMPGDRSPNQVCAQGPPAPDIVGKKTDGSKIGLGQCGGPHSAVASLHAANERLDARA